MEIAKQNDTKQEKGKSRGPLTALKTMATIPRKLNMDHLKSHLLSEPSKQMERNGPKGDEGSVVVFHVRQ
jgi:hypothetical protein